MENSENRDTQHTKPEITDTPPTENTTTATSELAALLSEEEQINAADLQEKPVELISETEDQSISWPVVIPAMLLILAIVVWGLGKPANFEATANSMLTWVLTNLGWAFVLFSTIFVIFVIVIALSLIHI